ncbi:MAG: site-specific integrase, partial [Conexibacteraceae bacterium]|nr:site-specific integrase [Conexibacteraceae bacterium]
MAALAAAQPQLNELTLDFLAYLELERGLSRNTLEAYRSDLQQFGEFLQRRGAQPLAVDGILLSDFVSELAEGRDGRRPAAASTLQRKIACLRSFYRHMRREGMLETDPTADLRPPRSKARLPRVLSRDQVNRLLEQPRGTSSAALRDRALLETMYAYSQRASAATQLRLSEL